MTEELKIIMDMMSKLTDDAVYGLIVYILYSLLIFMTKAAIVFYVLKRVLDFIYKYLKNKENVNIGNTITLKSRYGKVYMNTSECEMLMKRLRTISQSDLNDFIGA